MTLRSPAAGDSGVNMTLHPPAAGDSGVNMTLHAPAAGDSGVNMTLARRRLRRRKLQWGHTPHIPLCVNVLGVFLTLIWPILTELVKIWSRKTQATSHI